MNRRELFRKAGVLAAGIPLARCGLEPALADTAPTRVAIEPEDHVVEPGWIVVRDITLENIGRGE